MCFNDALAFDTTYSSNTFNKPLVIFVGVNNHFQTCVFGFALLMNEKIDTCTWVLEAFLECMQERTLRVVITDGDTSMNVAIAKCFSATVHRLYGWHLSTNVATNIKSQMLQQTLNHHISQRHFWISYKSTTISPPGMRLRSLTWKFWTAQQRMGWYNIRK